MTAGMSSPSRLGPHLPGWALGVLALAAAAFLGAFGAQYLRTAALAREAARLERHRLDLLAENAKLREEIRRLQSDDAYIEQLARRELGLVRPGEIELLIVPADRTGAKAPIDRTSPETRPAGTQRAGPWAWLRAAQSFLDRLVAWWHFRSRSRP